MASRAERCRTTRASPGGIELDPPVRKPHTVYGKKSAPHRRPRKYISTENIHRTFHRLKISLMEGSGWYSFQPPQLSMLYDSVSS